MQDLARWKGASPSILLCPVDPRRLLLMPPKREVGLVKLSLVVMIGEKSQKTRLEKARAVVDSRIRLMKEKYNVKGRKGLERIESHRLPYSVIDDLSSSQPLN